MREAAWTMLRKEGPRAFYKGWLPAIAYVGPYTGPYSLPAASKRGARPATAGLAFVTYKFLNRTWKRRHVAFHDLSSRSEGPWRGRDRGWEFGPRSNAALRLWDGLRLRGQSDDVPL